MGMSAALLMLTAIFAMASANCAAQSQVNQGMRAALHQPHPRHPGNKPWWCTSGNTQGLKWYNADAVHMHSPCMKQQLTAVMTWKAQNLGTEFMGLQLHYHSKGQQLAWAQGRMRPLRDCTRLNAVMLTLA